MHSMNLYLWNIYIYIHIHMYIYICKYIYMCAFNHKISVGVRSSHEEKTHPANYVRATWGYGNLIVSSHACMSERVRWPCLHACKKGAMTSWLMDVLYLKSWCLFFNNYRCDHVVQKAQQERQSSMREKKTSAQTHSTTRQNLLNHAPKPNHQYQMLYLQSRRSAAPQ